MPCAEPRPFLRLRHQGDFPIGVTARTVEVPGASMHIIRQVHPIRAFHLDPTTGGDFDNSGPWDRRPCPSGPVKGLTSLLQCGSARSS